ncbi:MAG TPA: FAD-dependent oxidoreductase, partial [Candidatus Binataceae bacterium]|nr:FAD-dependent oxidoreductase [Candidatus Binataceae bacterium]
MTARIVVLGSNFAGLTAALELNERLGKAAKLTVISKDDAFVFTPELIKIAFGLARRVDAIFPLRETMEARGIAFRVGSVEKIDLAQHCVLAKGEAPYDYLVIAAGSKPVYESVPGLGPFKGFTHSIFTIDEAEMAAAALSEFAKNPGPVVIGALPGSSFFWLVYEFLFNMAHYVRDRGLDNSPITYVTPEPYIGHFGIGGYGPATRAAKGLCESLGIKHETNAAIREITRDVVRLADGREFPFRFAMLAPNSIG